MNQSQKYLTHADNCLRGANTQLGEMRQRIKSAPKDHVEVLQLGEARIQREIKRLEDARKDLSSKLNSDELAAYDATRSKVKTAEQQKLDIAAATKLMNENKDRPGI